MQYGTLCGLTLDRKYRLGQYLGEWAETAVFATQLANGKGAVARVIAGDSPAAPFLYRSWTLAAGLDHPNLVRIEAAGEAELDGATGFYAITEQAEDVLSDIIATRTLTKEEAGEVLRAVVPCLEYLHRAGVAHGSVEASSVVAIGDSVKLTADTLTHGDAFGSAKQFGGLESRDIAGLGNLVVEMLTGRRPAHRSDAEQLIANSDLEPPFRDIAVGCVREERFGRWTLRQVAAALEPKAEPAPVAATPAEPQAPPKVRAGVTAAIAGGVLLVLFAVYGLFSHSPKSAAKAPAPAVEEPGVFPPPPARTATPKPSAMPLPQAAQTSPGGWAVVAAIYHDYDAAQVRAKSLSSKWHRGAMQVYPAKGAGSQYMVVVASGLSKDQAQKVQRQALAAGLPGDTYVTRLR